jgi:type I restriction enzyme S subunit
MKTYQSYTPSGIEWIGEIPDHWELLKFKFLFKEKKPVQNLELNCGSISFGKVIEKDDEGIPIERKLTYQEVLKDEFLINPLNLNFDLKSLRIGKSDINVVVSPGYIVLNLFKEGNNKQFYNYLLYVFDTQQMKSLGNGVRQTISFKHLSVEELLSPPLQEQQQIVKFLDEKTSIIDKLISTKERKIELLKEQRTSLINEVITNGLNPNVKMKDSGVEWIGEIPESWDKKKIKTISSIISKGTTPSTIGKEISDEGEFRYIKSENIVENSLSEYPQFFIDKETNELLKRSILFEGDILFVIAGASIGKTTILTKNFSNSNTNQAVSFIRLKENEKNRFVWYWLISPKIQEQMWIVAVQSAQPNLSMENLGNFYIPYPTIQEQQEIVEYLDKHTKEIDDLVQMEQKKIDLLKEYRQSLISEVITGKIKVVE